MSRRSRIAGLAVVGLAVTAGLLGAPLAAHAAAGVAVSNAQGTATVDPDYATEVTLRGSGFQSIQNGFGGVYVLFGWVDDPGGSSWKPSSGGVVGEDFRYVPDSESQDNQGFQRFVAFPGSDTEGAAHAVMAGDGSWSVSMVIPGAVFESKDRNGRTSSVDCRAQTCGVITIGAHGVKNANNETFTPIRFQTPAATAPGGADAAPAAAAPGTVRVGLASPTVEAGTSVAFTGQGFAPGEQIIATLDNGLVSVGPLSAGAQGEVAGVLPVPRDIRDGTHLVTLTGAASGLTSGSEVTVRVADLVAAAAAPETPMWVFVLLASSIALSLALVFVSVIASLRRAARRRRARRAHTVLDKSSAPRHSGPDAATRPLSTTGALR
ncbi:hypothetical protein ACTU3I_01305 [Microbacterium sp. RD1]|uniref:hypothetical protein n=1 Tax=Microbacterium sp. RD1 TaxID=3457313 RepID=UPI003FA58B3C